MTEQPSNTDNRNPHGAIGAIGTAGGSSSASAGKAKAEAPEPSTNNGTPNAQDPLAGMTDAQKWGLPGLRHLMNTDPTYSAFLQGIEAPTLGLDLQSPEYVSHFRPTMREAYRLTSNRQPHFAADLLAVGQSSP